MQQCAACVESISQAEMLAFPFDAAHVHEKLVSHGIQIRNVCFANCSRAAKCDFHPFIKRYQNIEKRIIIEKMRKEKIEKEKELVMKKQQVQEVLDRLDTVYGVTKQGFLHREPWQLLLAIMLSAQSTDKQVEEALPALWERFPSVDMMAEADIEEIEEKIRTIGLYKNKAKNMKKCCQQLLEQHDGEVPKTMEQLVELAGVGRKTANLFLSDAYDIPGITVDTHVMRISKRLGWAKGKNPEEVEYELQKVLPVEHWIRINFQLIYHGRAICTARKAHCEKCMLADLCEKHIEKKETKTKKK